MTIVFSDSSAAKKRPVLTVRDTGDVDLLVVPITSHPARGPEDVTLHDWQTAGLRLPSTARMSKFATVPKSIVGRKLGRLSDRDIRQTREALHRFCQTF